MTINLSPDQRPIEWTHASVRQLFRRALLEDVRAWLASKTNPELVPAYALVDAGQLHLTEVDFVSLLGDARLSYEPLLRHTSEAQLEAVGPYLIDLGHTASHALEAIVGLMDYGWPVSFLSTRLPVWKLHTHLRSCLNAELENGTPVQFRFYDSRVMTSLLTLDDAEPLRTAILKPLDTLAGWDRSLQWQVTNGSNCPSFRTEQEYFVLPQTILAALAKAGEPDLLLSKLLADDLKPGELDVFAPHQRYQMVASLVHRARHHGLTSEANLRLFCSTGLRAGIAFDKALPGITQALASPLKADADFMPAAVAVTNAEWGAAIDVAEGEFFAIRKNFVDALISRISP